MNFLCRYFLSYFYSYIGLVFESGITKYTLKKLSLLFLFFSFSFVICFAQQNDIDIALKSADYKYLSSFFNSSIELNILDNEGLYSKVQAEIILKDFFQKNNPTNFTSKYTGFSKDGSKYSIGNLVTNSGNYRTYFFFKKIGENMLIKEFRIERDK